MRTRRLTSAQANLLASELDNAALWDGMSERKAQMLNVIATATHQGRVRISIERPIPTSRTLSDAGFAYAGSLALEGIPVQVLADAFTVGYKRALRDLETGEEVTE